MISDRLRPLILSGKPCVGGTCLSVEFLLERAASGATQDQILAHCPQLTADRRANRSSPAGPATSRITACPTTPTKT
jgi:hypothetical protein